MTNAAIAIWREAAQIVRNMQTHTPPASEDAWNFALDRASKALEQRAAELERGDTQILSQLKSLFDKFQTDRMATKDILRELEKNEVSPGASLDSRRLSRELARHGVQPVTFKIGESATKGYVTYPTKTQVGLAAAWRQYL
ncbi:DUF3631 domain-containing protein [Crossiella sp. CA198]|uniref:DUF3631 domain-containing protein n=1 Tax=Crossiella sp. CA198 TaxID=3455607 RepID=UPI003F8CF8E9